MLYEVITDVKSAAFDKLDIRNIAVGIEIKLDDIVSVDAHVLRNVHTSDAVEYLLGDAAHNLLIVQNVLLFPLAQLAELIAVELFDILIDPALALGAVLRCIVAFLLAHNLLGEETIESVV